MLLTNYFSFDVRGVILYAMVCGRLPFGDDSQIAKMTDRELHFTRPISHGELVRYYTAEPYILDQAHCRLIMPAVCIKM